MVLEMTFARRTFFIIGAAGRPDMFVRYMAATVIPRLQEYIPL